MSWLLAVPPLGQCWSWDQRFLVASALSNILIFFGFALVVVVTLFIYKRAGLRSLVLSYPRLWRSGIIFVLACAVSRLGQVAEIWYGGFVFSVVILLNVLTGMSSLWFVFLLWQTKIEMILAARILHRALMEQNPMTISAHDSRELEE